MVTSFVVHSNVSYRGPCIEICILPWENMYRCSPTIASVKSLLRVTAARYLHSKYHPKKKKILEKYGTSTPTLDTVSIFYNMWAQPQDLVRFTVASSYICGLHCRLLNLCADSLQTDYKLLHGSSCIFVLLVYVAVMIGWVKDLTILCIRATLADVELYVFLCSFLVM